MKRAVHPLIRIPSLLLAGLMAGTAAAAGVEFTGAGASLPAPIYQEWGQSLGGGRLHYQSVGSGNGIELLLAGKVDFGASDRPLRPEELAKNRLVQFPAVIGAVVPVVNIEGIGSGQLRLDGETLARIYLGRITRWNDPAIVALNRDLHLPDASIAAIYRVDASGSTFLFTNYLSKVNAEWRRTMGEGAKIDWKTGTGGMGSRGVISYMHRLKNAIGYLDFNQAVQSGLAQVQMKSRDGQFVSPSLASIKAAAANANWDRNTGFYEILTDQQGGSWPICGASFVLMHEVQVHPEVAQAVLRFFDLSYSNGAPAAEGLNFVPLPAATQESVRAEWKRRIRDGKGHPVW